MEYMFHQQPKPANAKGVPVSLDTIDPNGNLVHIGNTTSDISGNYALPYTPEIPGTYQIIAMFAGSKSYGPSTATTYLTIGEAPLTPTPQPAVAQSPVEMYILVGRHNYSYCNSSSIDYQKKTIAPTNQTTFPLFYYFK